MSNGDHQNTNDGWRLWLADQVMSIRGSLGKLEAQGVSNWQAIGQVHHHLTHRMDRIEDRMANGHRRLGWLRHVPYIKIALLLIATLLVATGHLTVAEIKAFVIKRLLD